MVYCNTTLTDETSTSQTDITINTKDVEEDPLFSKVTFHHVGLIICIVFTIISTVISFFLMQKHATHYSKPWEQKHIIRIILMLPVYSIVSFLSYLFYTHDIYFEVIRDCYEAFAIASFFTLLCNYIAPNLHEQKDYFRQLTPINWFWSVFGLQKCTGGQDKGILRRPKSGLTWFNVVWIGVFQYCFVRVFFTTVSVISQAYGRYCEESLNPAFAHVWTMIFESVAVTFAMFFLVQFYLQLKTDLAEHRPFLKVLCIKLVIFFSFWQSLLISFLTSAGVITTSKKLASADIKIGIPSMLLCIEMAIFAVMHLFAFPWREYDLSKPSNMNPVMAPGSGFSGPKPEYKGGKFGLKAWLDAFNVWDIVKASARGFRWLFVGRKYRHHDISYKTADPLNEPQTSIPGPNVTTETVPSATELQRRGRSDTVEASYDDRVGLLSNAQKTAIGRSPSPSPNRQDSYESHDDEVDIGAGRTAPTAAFPEAHVYGGNYGGGYVPVAPITPVTPADPRAPGNVRWDTDTSYHAAPSAPSTGAVQGQGPEWDHWAGAKRE